MLDDKGVRRRFRASNYQVCIIERMEGREKENEANGGKGGNREFQLLLSTYIVISPPQE